MMETYLPAAVLLAVVAFALGAFIRGRYTPPVNRIDPAHLDLSGIIGGIDRAKTVGVVVRDRRGQWWHLEVPDDPTFEAQIERALCDYWRTIRQRVDNRATP